MELLVLEVQAEAGFVHWLFTWAEAGFVHLRNNCTPFPAPCHSAVEGECLHVHKQRLVGRIISSFANLRQHAGKDACYEVTISKGHFECKEKDLVLHLLYNAPFWLFADPRQWKDICCDRKMKSENK